MPITLRSRPTDTNRARSPSPFETPAAKNPIPTIRLVTATPATVNSPIASWPAPQPPLPLAPKASPSDAAPRKRLVPKKSKLGILSSRETDLSDVVRRVGAGDSDMNGGAGIEIYVDPTHDPDIGEILIVKKKKSRLALDGMRWGPALGEVTNVPHVKEKEKKERKKDKENTLKTNMDEKGGWWTIGRGRKDSKEKENSKAPEPICSIRGTDSRARFNSLDSGILLNSPVLPERPKSPTDNQRLRVPTPPSATLTSTAMLAPPAPAQLGSGKDSVALRAMRSVRSLARIGSWAQLKNIPAPAPDDATPAPPAPMITEPKKKKKKKVKEKEKENEKEKDKATLRYSGSSFEAGALTASPEKASLRLKKKKSILGLGLPSTMRLPSMRSGSTASSIVAAQMHTTGRLSADSAAVLGGGILGRARSGSTRTASSAGSVRPVSVSSGGSSGGCSVRWDETLLETVKEVREKERALKKEKGSTKKGKKSKETRKTSDSRKRTPLAAIFPGGSSECRDAEEELHGEGAAAPPIVTIEEASSDGHGQSDLETPMKRARPRPMSEMLLGRSRPKAVYEDENENAVISLLDAATNDLAQLINHLDLEATPDMTPMSRRTPSSLAPSEAGSPTKYRMTLESPIKTLRANVASVSSLRPYAKTIFAAPVQSIGQNIAPWATLNAGISPGKPAPPPKDAEEPEPAPAFRLTHKRTLSPAPAAEPELIFQALRPAVNRAPVSGRPVFPSLARARIPFIGDADRSPSSRTFGSAHSTSGSRGSLGTSPVFKKAKGHHRKESSLVSSECAQSRCDVDIAGSIGNERDSMSLPILPDARRNLGLAGTLGGSVGAQELDASDPDSDIPDELQVILSSSDPENDDTMSFKPNQMITHSPLPSPGLPPEMPLPSPKGSIPNVPVFCVSVVDEDDHHADIEEAEMSSEDDTKKSFDFTGELKKLNESGGSDRLSFVEQLENAFRTPANLRYDFDLQLDAPPVPKIPSLQAELERAGDRTFDLPMDYISQEFLPQGFPMDVDAEPSLLPGTDSFATTTDGKNEDFLCAEHPQVLRAAGSVLSRPSDGQLNRDFKFGGKPSSAPAEKKEAEPLTLSDIIPPSAVARSLSTTSLSGDESAVLKSIFAKAIEIPSPPSRVRLDSDSTSKRIARMTARASNVPSHYRHSSELSFAGFDSFTEVRRGFEFHDNRPNFYPPPATTSRSHHNKRESMFSIASISSYGQVINNGSMDPFDYGAIAPLPSLRERPSSDEFSFSMSSIDDTFSFIHRQPRRRRVDSDASSFYFRASVHSQMHPYNRVTSHRRHSSSASVASQGPPVSLFNRGYGHHRDSTTSMGGAAQSYARGGRASWTRHRSEFSADSVLSDFSGMNLGRPGLGDKMLDSALDRGMPLTAISASPPESPSGSVLSEQFQSDRYANRTSYDSIMASDPEPQRVFNMEDSIFEKTGHRTSVSSSDSAFFDVDSSHALPQFRPLSSFSVASVHSPPKEDDTMISMLGGGHVRRRSVGSMIETSPCRQVEKRKHVAVDQPTFRLRGKPQDNSYESPKSRVIETKPSIASTANSIKFGGERMIRAKHGLLERQSLEATALIADGEEDLSTSFRAPVFTRPSRANRSRSSTCTSMSSGADTPPLSISDGYSSFSEGSQSSIDLSQVNCMLSNVTHPLSNATLDRVRPRARGHGHQRRISQARASRTSIYETIEEELTTSVSPTSSLQSLPSSVMKTVQLPNSPTQTIGRAPLYIVDPETASVDSVSLWDDERGIMALRKYYALRDEAQDTVTESKQVWHDTPFSVFAVQSFDPPRHPSGMKALLEHSLQNYCPLPSELRRMRSRANSRPSPYPRTLKTSYTSAPATEHVRAAIAAAVAENAPNDTVRVHAQPKALQQISVNPNIMSPAENTKATATTHDAAMSPSKLERVFGLPPRPRVGSTARRAALGWAKRSTGRNGVENKENASFGLAAISQGLVMTPSETLRLNRPRPRGRATPASTRPIRV